MVFYVITMLVVGGICIAVGISNYKGNISSLHSYHRNRVSEADKQALGRGVGLGMLLIGGALIADGGFALVSMLTEKEIFMLIGTIVMLVGLTIGIILALYTIKKYNKGIF